MADPTQNEPRIMCQVCRRMLVSRKDGTSRNHYSHRYPATIDRYDRSYCKGSGYRLARWEVGQKLRHHSGCVWEVVEDRGGRCGDYVIRCLSIPQGIFERPVGTEMVTHGEYMHRHGWTPLPPDLMAALEASLKAAPRA